MYFSLIVYQSKTRGCGEEGVGGLGGRRLGDRGLGGRRGGARGLGGRGLGGRVGLRCRGKGGGEWIGGGCNLFPSRCWGK